jgi:hypothetical protein
MDSTSDSPPLRPVFNQWTHPQTGEVRRYITNVAEIIGFAYLGYGAKVHGGVLNGESISNNQTYKLVELIDLCKFWVDDQLHLHYRNVVGTSSRYHTPQSIADAINATRTRKEPT